MNHFDDLPQRGNNRQIQEQSEFAFEAAVGSSKQFVIQSQDKYDYGSDYVLEAASDGVMTNVRIHVQLKGTDSDPNSDGSFSISIARKNLNYLAMPPGSLFVCYQVSAKQLFVKRVDEVIREYEHRGVPWGTQHTITVRFSEMFEEEFQQSLNLYVVAYARDARNFRLSVLSAPPYYISEIVEEGSVDLPVPANRDQAAQMLSSLYSRGHDRAISQSFNKFHAVFGSSDPSLMLGYMAEINLGINGQEFNRQRVLDGIQVLSGATDGGLYSPGSLLYCIGNGWLALEEYEQARDQYNSALIVLDKEGSPGVAAQCCKNLGTVMEKLHHSGAAYALYTRALELDPELAEAHFAKALCLNRENKELDDALDHLDKIIWSAPASGNVSSVHGWRAEILFKQQKVKEAFREIRTLLAVADRRQWVWPWCAKLVATYGRVTVDAAQQASEYWGSYLNRFPDGLFARREQLLCMWLVRANGGTISCDYVEFKRMVEDLVDGGIADPAFLWDRAGHWAQDDGNWAEAEKCYRKAFELSASHYGYCLGTALNCLGRHTEALPILIEQAMKLQPDAMSWFQVAVAREGIGDPEGSISAYRRALGLDEQYDLAWFNLGGVYWNSGDKGEAVIVWKEAIRRFPEHLLSAKLLRDLPDLFDL